MNLEITGLSHEKRKVGKLPHLPPPPHAGGQKKKKKKRIGNHFMNVGCFHGLGKVFFLCCYTSIFHSIHQSIFKSWTILFKSF